MNNNYILAIDEGTSSARAVLVNMEGQAVYIAREPIQSKYPISGWVEQDPKDILKAQTETIRQVLFMLEPQKASILAAGVTNQRETTIVWNKKTSEPLYPAIVWQDRRGEELCKQLKDAGYENLIQKKTGLVLDSYFSAAKIAWILQNVAEARELAKSGELAFGTVDTWLLWHFTGNHYTEPSNASRTLLYNIHTHAWDEELLAIFDIPPSVLPTILPSNGLFGYLELGSYKIPITGVLGDQQAATFGQACFEYGATKNTYGTGCFLVTQTGTQPINEPPPGILTTVAWKMQGSPAFYALEGAILNAGASLQWLLQVGILESFESIDENISYNFANPELFFVPALTGLGAPHWDSAARGLIIGINRNTQKKDLVAAALAAMAFQTLEIVQLLEKAIGVKINRLKVDGGVAQNRLLMQFQADLSGCTVSIPVSIETTALGVAFMAGIGAGLFSSLEEIAGIYTERSCLQPSIALNRDALMAKWLQAVERTKNWAD
jgi:glycerol kinase